MKLLQMIVFSRMKRQKIRLLFVLLAIAASSCLIIWTVGGYQSLFKEAANEEADYLGTYDIRIGFKTSNGMGEMRRGFGGGFGGPFAQRGATNLNDSLKEISTLKKDRFKYARNADGKIELAKIKAPSHILDKIRIIDLNNDGFLDSDEEKKMAMNRQPVDESKEMSGMKPGQGSGMRGGRPNGADSVIPEKLITEIKADPSVIVCDETSIIRGFVYSPNQKNRFSSIESNLQIKEQAFSENNNFQNKQTVSIAQSSGLEKSDVQDSDIQGPNAQNSAAQNSMIPKSTAPKGIDPELHRKGMAAFRAVMGTPMGMGIPLTGTSAENSPYEMKEGQWLRQNSEAHEAVLTENQAKDWKAKPGDDLLVIMKSSEFQLKIVGVINDPLSTGIYISKPLAEKISSTKQTVISLGLKLMVSVEDFRKKWEPQLVKTVPGLLIQTEKELADQKKEETKREENLFQYQAISGTILAVLASIFIIFTTLTMNVNAQKRQIALYRMIGLTRGQINASILLEALILAIPGWLGGIVTGWLLLYWNTGKILELNPQMILFSFGAALIGAVIAAFYPMIQVSKVKPLDAFPQTNNSFFASNLNKNRTLFFWISFLMSGIFIGGDLYLVYFLPVATEQKAMLHSGIGIFLLTLGVLALIPSLIKITELFFVPVLAGLFHFDSKFLRQELSANLTRTIAVTILLSMGGGLFVSMQIWGYSMLGPFLPGREMPECFAAFMPTELSDNIVQELKEIPGIKSKEFLSIAVEQAAFADGSIQKKEGMGGAFENVIFFGTEVEQAFNVSRPMVELHFIQGKSDEAIESLKNNRGVIINDSISVDYGLKVGDTLKVVHPRDNSKILEYPIVGVISFPGWQWLSKTGGVRRNFGRSGGIVFANKKDIINDYQLKDYRYFWFNTDGSRSFADLESDLDLLAQKNLKNFSETESSQEKSSEKESLQKKPLEIESFSQKPMENESLKTSEQMAYVKLSTRESLYYSIMSRAENVIWGLSKMPLITLIIMSIAVIGAITNSVRSRRLQFGIMRSIGITRGAIIRMILIEAILIGIVASLTSFLFGFLAAQGALKLGQSLFGTVDPPLIFPFQGLFCGFCLTLFLCLLAAIYPAISTGLKQPLQLLQEGRE